MTSVRVTYVTYTLPFLHLLGWGDLFQFFVDGFWCFWVISGHLGWVWVSWWSELFRALLMESLQWEHGMSRIWGICIGPEVDFSGTALGGVIMDTLFQR